MLRTREPEFLGSFAAFAAYREKSPASFARIQPLMPFPEASFAVLPIIAEDRAVGGICFTYDHRRQFAPADRAYKLLLARQYALAIERVQHLEAEARARAEVELRYDLTAGVNRLDDIAAVFDLALSTVIRGSRCDRAAILLFDDGGAMRFIASHGLSEIYRAAVEATARGRRTRSIPCPSRSTTPSSIPPPAARGRLVPHARPWTARPHARPWTARPHARPWTARPRNDRSATAGPTSSSGATGMNIHSDED